MSQVKYPHVAQEFQELCDASDHARVRHMLTERFINYPRAAELLNHVDFLMTQPRQTRAYGLVIIGEPGNGKTMIARAVVRRHNTPMNRVAGHLVKPVVMISMTGARDAHTIYNRLLDALGGPNSSSMRRVDREQLVIHLLRSAGTILIIVDEIQDLLTSTDRQQRFALDTLKLIMNEVGLSILCLGTVDAERAMQTDSHLNARFEYRALPRWQANADTRALLQAVERSLPLKERSDLSSMRMMKVIVERSGGRLARIMRMVNHAAVFAVEHGAERIGETALEEAGRAVPSAVSLRPREVKTGKVETSHGA